MKHYVYKLDDPVTGEFYFGSRSCKCEIKDDTYMGSMKTWKPDDKSRLTKTILREFQSRRVANEYETYLINKYYKDPLNENYHSNDKFCTFGTTRDRDTNPLTGRTLSTGTKQKISDNNARYWKGKRRPEHSKKMLDNNPFKDCQHTTENINKMKTKARGRFTKEWFITKYGTEQGLIKYNDRNTRLSDRNVIMYEDKSKHPMFGRTGSDNPKSKTVYQYDIDGTFIREWSGSSEAARSLGINQSSISRCCNGKLKTSGGFIWSLTKK